MTTNTPEQSAPKTLFTRTLVENMRKARKIMELVEAGEEYLSKTKGGKKTKK